MSLAGEHVREQIYKGNERPCLVSVCLFRHVSISAVAVLSTCSQEFPGLARLQTASVGLLNFSSPLPSHGSNMGVSHQQHYHGPVPFAPTPPASDVGDGTAEEASGDCARCRMIWEKKAWRYEQQPYKGESRYLFGASYICCISGDGRTG